MPKIKAPPITLAPSYAVPKISVAQESVTKAPPPRVIPSGKRMLARAIGDLGDAVGDVAKYAAASEKVSRNLRNSVEVSDRIADMENDLSQHYINNVASRKSGNAKDIFRDEVEVIEGMKRVALQGVENDVRLHGMLSLEFDKLAQKHLQKVANHKLLQDANYAKDTAFKVAKNLQAEMSTLTLRDGSRALDISNQLNEQLAEYSELREVAKITAWKGFFKFNARINPELAQVAYENPTMHKSIVNQIGSEGYSIIQEAIDKGRAIGIQDKALAKTYAKEQEDDRVELHMSDAMHTFFEDIKNKTTNFNATYIDTLGTQSRLPSPEQRILNNLLSSITKKTLTPAEVDWPTYRELLENVRRGKASGESILEIGNDIISQINRTITTTQGQSLLKALAGRDVFDKPTIQEAYDKLENMYKIGRGFESWEEYDKAVQSLTDNVLKNDGDPKKVQEFMQSILTPPERKGGIRRALENAGVLRPTPEFSDIPGSPTRPYLLEWEEKEINKLIEQEGHVGATVDKLTDRSLQKFLDKIRSKKYQKGQ